MSTVAARWIEREAAAAAGSNAELPEYLHRIADLYERKLWHQLTAALEELVNLPQFEKGTFLLDLYQNFIKTFESHLQPLRLAHMIIKISKQISNPQEAISFLTEAAEKVKQNKECSILLRCTIGSLHLQLENWDECKTIVDQTGDALEVSSGIDSTVYASFYFLKANYEKVKGTAEGFYRNMLLYLAYFPIDNIPPLQRRTLAFDLCLAALIGDEVFNFGELLTHPILSALTGTENSWVSELLLAFNKGDIDEYERLVEFYQAKLNAQPALVNNSQTMKEKIAILCLMELVFNRSADDRVIPFSVIAQATKLPETEVELLLMRALSLGLIRGFVDEVDRVVTITWLQPRVLNTDQLQHMKVRLGEWQEKTKALRQFMEEETPELFA